MNNLLIVGASGHAKVVIDILELSHTGHIVGLLDDFKPPGSAWYGYPVLGGLAQLPVLAKQYDINDICVAVGDNWGRSQVVEKIRQLAPTLRFLPAVHPSVQIGRGALIGQGVVIAAGAVINSDCRVGDFCLINVNASLTHDCEMGAFSSLAPNATVGGNVVIGAFTAISIGASVKNGISIGEHTVVGAGASVVRDLPGHSVCYGVPADVKRARRKDEPYL